MAGRVHIETFGCQMNEWESDRLLRTLCGLHGFEPADGLDDADIIVCNTCSVRDRADRKAFSFIGRLGGIKRRRPGLIVAVGGCLVKSRCSEIRDRAPHADIVLGTHQWAVLPELIARVRRGGAAVECTDFSSREDFRFQTFHPSSAARKVSEFVAVQNGCDRFCSFCIVPFTRGREISRPHGEILDEVRALADCGVREVTLLGQNVNAYGSDPTGEITFAALIERVSEIEGVERIRFTTSNPAAFSAELAAVIESNSKVCRHLHLPLQSGSDRVLGLMNRGYTLERYRRIVSDLRSRIPGMALTTDLIVGFPSETEEDFEATLAAMGEFRFDDSFSFCFSPRPGTKAAKWGDQAVTRQVGSERLRRLQELQSVIRSERSRAYVGSLVEVLVEGAARRGEGFLTGRTRTNYIVNFAGPKSFVGETVLVRVDEALSHSLRGELKEKG